MVPHEEGEEGDEGVPLEEEATPRDLSLEDQRPASDPIKHPDIDAEEDYHKEETQEFLHLVENRFDLLVLVHGVRDEVPYVGGFVPEVGGLSNGGLAQGAEVEGLGLVLPNGVGGEPDEDNEGVDCEEHEGV